MIQIFKGIFKSKPNVAFLSAAVILLLGGWQVEHGYRLALSRANQDARNLSQALSEHIERSIETVDLVLDGGVERLEQGALDQPAVFDKFLEKRARSVKQVHAFVLYNAVGDWLLTGGRVTPKKMNSGDRAFFRSHVGLNDRVPHLGAPIISRLDGRPIIPISRRWNKPDGSFGGVLLASLAPDYFETFYKRIGVGQNDSVRVVTEGGLILFSQPPTANLDARDPSDRAIIDEAASGSRNGSVRIRSARDHVDRIVGYDKLANRPLLVVTERSVDDALASWRREAIIEASALLFAAALLVLVGVSSMRSQRSEEATAKAIRASEALHRLLTENSSDLIAIKPTFGGPRTYVSPACPNIIGWEADEFARLTPSDFVHPDDLDDVIRRYGALSAENATYVDLHRVRHKDGRWIWLESRFSLVNPGTDEAHVVSTARDVTTKRESAEALAASEALYRTLADSLPQMLWISRADDFCLVYANSRFKTYHGTIDDSSDARIARYHPEDFERMLEVWAQAVPNGLAYEVHGRLMRHDEVYRWHKIIGVPLRRDGKLSEWIVTALDIDDILVATSRLNEATDLLHLSQEAAGAGRYEFNVRSGMMTLCRDGARLHGMDVDKAVVLTAEEWLTLVDPEDRSRMADEVAEALRMKGRQSVEFRVRGLDGSTRWLTGVGHAYHDDTGEATKVVGLNFDMTDQKLAERLLLQTNVEAKEAREIAERASVAKSDFLANMSHEIRTPLNSIIGWTDLLLDEHREGSDLSRKLLLIQESGNALLTVVNDILDFSKIEAGQVELDVSAFSPVSLIDNVASMMTGLAAAKGVAIAREIDPTTPKFLIGDESRLRQILLNLMNNAIKFTNVGDIAIGLRIASLSKSSVALHFTVKDSGIGISESQQKRLFERFSQVDGSITRRFGGTGLGLAICKQLVDLMDGTIGVDSHEGEGSTFWFRVELRVAEPVAPFVSSVSTDEGVGGPASHILLVEDVILNQDLAKAVLERWGHTVDVACNGAEAVEMVRATRYDLVLMDVQMPIMDGVTATRHIRDADHPSNTIPIIAMTANVLPQQIAALRHSGMDDHVGKPFKRADLQKAIDHWARKANRASAVDA